MWELDCEEGWVQKNWCFWTVVLEKTLESPLDCKETQPVPPEGDQFWVYIGRTDAKAETPIFWPPHGKSWLIGRDSDAGQDWGQEEKGTTEDEMAWWHHLLYRHVWVDSGRWWWTGRPGVLWFMGSQRVRHDWATELNSHCWGFSLLPGSYFIYLFFASYFPPHILYHTIPSEPAVTVFLNTNLFQKPVFITYGRYLEPTEWQIYLLRLLLLLNFWDQYQQTCEELPVVYLGIYQEFPSLPVLCQPT